MNQVAKVITPKRLGGHTVRMISYVAEVPSRVDMSDPRRPLPDDLNQDSSRPFSRQPELSISEHEVSVARVKLLIGDIGNLRNRHVGTVPQNPRKIKGCGV